MLKEYKIKFKLCEDIHQTKVPIKMKLSVYVVIYLYIVII